MASRRFANEQAPQVEGTLFALPPELVRQFSNKLLEQRLRIVVRYEFERLTWGQFCKRLENHRMTIVRINGADVDDDHGGRDCRSGPSSQSAGIIANWA